MAAAYHSLRKAAGPRTIKTEDSPIGIASLQDVNKVRKGILSKRVSEWQNRYVALKDDNDAMQDAEEAYIQSLQMSPAERTRLAVRHMYEHDITQGLVSTLLLANFASSIIQRELAGRDTRDAQQLSESLDVVDMVFTFVYSVELLVCIYCTPWQELFTSGWCW